MRVRVREPGKTQHTRPTPLSDVTKPLVEQCSCNHGTSMLCAIYRKHHITLYYTARDHHATVPGCSLHTHICLFVTTYDRHRSHPVKYNSRIEKKHTTKIGKIRIYIQKQPLTPTKHNRHYHPLSRRRGGRLPRGVHLDAAKDPILDHAREQARDLLAGNLIGVLDNLVELAFRGT